MTKPPETRIEPTAAAGKRGGRLLPPARHRHPGDLIRLIIAGPTISAVLLHRLAPYWLPVTPGWLCWRVLQRREYA